MIDTAKKRRSVSGIGAHPHVPGVTPNAARDETWRQESGWSYSGIAPPPPAGAPTPAVFLALSGVNGYLAGKGE